MFIPSSFISSHLTVEIVGKKGLNKKIKILTSFSRNREIHILLMEFKFVKKMTKKFGHI